MRPRALLALLMAIGLAFPLVAGACGGEAPTLEPSPTPGIEARLHVAVTEIAPDGETTHRTWRVTFIYNGHVVTAPTAPGVRPSMDLVGKRAIVDGAVERDGSFIITSIESEDG